MSWHHVDYIETLSAIGGVVSAVAAAYAAIQSRKSANDSFNQQRQSLRFERERHLIDLLKADALKANSSVQNHQGQDWSFFQAANVTYAIDSAKQLIKDSSSYMSPDDTERLKSFFKDQLCHEIISEMKQGNNVPDGFLDSHKGFKESREIIRLWMDNLSFFKFLKNK